MFRKETVFEGYFVSYYETSCLEKDLAYYLKSKHPRHVHMKRWFKQHLKELAEKAENEKPKIICFEDIIPKHVYRKLMRNPNTKFRFKIIVEAKEIHQDGDKQVHGV